MLGTTVQVVALRHVCVCDVYMCVCMYGGSVKGTVLGTTVQVVDVRYIYIYIYI